MSESKSAPGRARDADRTRKKFLSAAEIVFAEHGFDGARLDAIAKLSSYNKSLIGQYFGDKLGLYAAVIVRADTELNELLSSVYAPLLQDETAAADADSFRMFLKAMVQTIFDYLLEHPRFLRILTWEMAEGWQTYRQIASQVGRTDIERFRTLSASVQSAGLLRSDFFPEIQLTMVAQICQSYLAFLPVYETSLQGGDLSSASALAKARDYLAELLVAGMVVDPAATKPGSGKSFYDDGREKR